MSVLLFVNLRADVNQFGFLIENCHLVPPGRNLADHVFSVCLMTAPLITTVCLLNHCSNTFWGPTSSSKVTDGDAEDFDQSQIKGIQLSDLWRWWHGGLHSWDPETGMDNSDGKSTVQISRGKSVAMRITNSIIIPKLYCNATAFFGNHQSLGLQDCWMLSSEVECDDIDEGEYQEEAREATEEHKIH